MRVLVQRSLSSRVSVDDKVIGSIPKGFVLLVGFSKEDTTKSMAIPEGTAYIDVSCNGGNVYVYEISI